MTGEGTWALIMGSWAQRENTTVLVIYNTVMNLVTMAVPENERGHAIGIVVAGV